MSEQGLMKMMGKKKDPKKKAAHIGMKFKKVAETFNLCRFWTFTFYQELSEKERMERWNAFITTLRYWFPMVQYLGAKEYRPSKQDGKLDSPVKPGSMHLHMLFNLFIPWKWPEQYETPEQALKAGSFPGIAYYWKKSGAGEVCWVEYVKPRRVATYICKYILKTIENGLIERVVVQSRKMCIHLSSFLKWAEKTASWGCTDALKFLLDNIKTKEYNEVAGRLKRKHYSRLWCLAADLGI